MTERNKIADILNYNSDQKELEEGKRMTNDGLKKKISDIIQQAGKDYGEFLGRS